MLIGEQPHNRRNYGELNQMIENIPGPLTPNPMPQEVPSLFPEGVPGPMPEITPDPMPQDPPGPFPERAPDPMPGEMPGALPDTGSD